MLNQAAKRKEVLEASRSFSELVPWALRLGDSLVLNKDSSLMMMFRLKGVDPDSADQAGHEQIARNMDQAWRLLDERGMLWANLRRRRLGPSDMDWWKAPEVAGRRINAEFRKAWRSELLKREWFSNEPYLAVLLSPESQRSAKYLEQVGILTTEEGMPIGKALVAAMRSSVLSKGQYEAESRRLMKRASELNAVAMQIADLLSALGPELLSGEALDQALHDLVSPVNSGQPVSVPEGEYLDAALPDCELDASGNTLLFKGAGGERHAVSLTVRAWPSRTSLMLLDGLSRTKGEITYSIAFRMVPPEQAEKAIQRVKSYHSAMQISFKNYIKQAFGKTSQPQPDRPQHIRYTKEADAALTNLSANRYGYLNISIVCYGKSRDEADELARRITQYVQRLGFLVVRETQHALAAWTATLPGQWAECVRWKLMTASNFTDLFPARSSDAGGVVDKPFSEQVGKEIGPLGVFPTREKSLYRYLPTVGGVGHSLVVGPTGAGKSTIMNFLIAQWLGYPGARVYIFDQKYSCRVPVVVQGGRYIDFAGDADGGGVTLNPLSLLDDPNETAWVVDWVQGLMESRMEKGLSAEESLAVSEAVQRLQQISEHDKRLRTLSRVRFLLPRELQPLLGDWTHGIGDEPSDQPGRYAKYFDNAEDQFDVSGFLGVELGLLARQAPRVAVAALEYMDRRIRREMDGSPTFIYIEEAWFALSDPHFLARIETWLRTLRSLNGVVYMATQSLTEIAESEKFSLLLDSIPNRVYLPNPNATETQRDLYMKKFGLNSRQLQIIANARPRQEYYFAREGAGHIVSCSLGGWLRDMVRSDRVALRALDQAEAGGGDVGGEYFRLMKKHKQGG